MPFWNRSKAGAPVTEAERVSDEISHRAGDRPCTERGCALTTGLSCAYVDRRGRRCPTSWCPEHRLVMDGKVYCRRHAGIVSALPGGSTSSSAPLPDLENRAPSLVSWVAREVDADIRRLLLAELDDAGGAQLITDPVYLIFVGPERRRAWERAWKLVTHTGTALRVALMVEEEVDSELAVKIGANVLERMVPPWIARRHEARRPDAEGDAQRRREFNERLIEVIRLGIENERRITRIAAESAHLKHTGDN